jgi:hypothetical protein
MGRITGPLAPANEGEYGRRQRREPQSTPDASHHHSSHTFREIERAAVPGMT